MAISEPINPMAAHLGAGVVQLYTEPPVSGELDVYEVQCAISLAGPYSFVMNRFFNKKDAVLYGFAIGLNAYLRIRARDTEGNYSNWVQVKRAIVNTPLVGVTCRCIKGSVIPEGAVFSVTKKPDRIAGLVAAQTIEF
jgi:hypothetical protein